MEDSHKNYKNYRAGKEPLANAVLQHPAGSDVYNYLKGQVQRNFWIIPFKDWEKKQKKLRLR